MVTSLSPAPSTPTLPASTEPPCPRHDGPLVEGFSARLIHDFDGSARSEHRRAWFCVAPGCTFRRVENN